MTLPILVILISTLICSVAQASEVDDRCSADLPCSPSSIDSDPHFCDYQIGPEVGGYCVACEGRQTTFCSAEETGLTEAGRVDCVDKCRYKNCIDDPCDEGYFCSYYNYADGPCRPCKTSVVHPEECDIWGFRDGGTEECKDKCVPRTCSKRSHCSSVAEVQFFCNFDNLEAEEGSEDTTGVCEECTGMKSIEECNDRSASDLALQECSEVCVDNVLTSCDTNEDCLDRDNFFCNVNTTLCQRCPSTVTFGPDWHVNQCFDSTSRLGLVDDSSQSNCAEACHTECQHIREGSIISVQEGLVDIGKDDTIPMRGTPYASVSGVLVDCQFGEEGSCAADALDYNFICLISRGVNKFSDKAINCADQGGIASIVYNNQENTVLQ